MRSISLKLTLAFVFTGLFAVILVAGLARWTTLQAFDQLTLEKARDEFVNTVTAYYQEHGSWEGIHTVFPSLVSEDEKNSRFPFVLIDPGGRVIIETSPLPPGQVTPLTRREHGIPIRVDGQLVGTVMTLNAPPPRTPGEEQFLTRVNHALLAAAGGVTLMGALLSVFLARRLTQPIRELTRATRRIAAGDLEQQVPVSGKDELGELAESFNRMSADLARANHQRRQMTADIAHDLRTPLTVIGGHLEGLRDGVLKPNPARFDVMYDETQHLMRLVEDLRTLSLADAGELPLYCSMTSPKELLDRAAAGYAPQAELKGITLAVQPAVDLPDIYIDHQRMMQVLGNLITNALRYTPEGGRIDLKAESGDQSVRLMVRDTGTGISPEDLPRIFDRFYRVDSSRQGNHDESGLGLTIARSIVEMHDGHIDVESTPGEGTTFIITLPHRSAPTD